MNDQASKAGKALAKLGASAGGKAAAASMTKEARSDRARKAVMTRWANSSKAQLFLAMLHAGEKVSVATEDKAGISALNALVFCGKITVTANVNGDEPSITARLRA